MTKQSGKYEDTWAGRAGTTRPILVVIIVSQAPRHQPELEHLHVFPSSVLPCIYCIYSAIMEHHWKCLSRKWPLPTGHWAVNLKTEHYSDYTEPPENFYPVKLAFTLHEILQSIDKFSSLALFT